MVQFPKIKKRINDFLVEEEGKIDKSTLIKTGFISSATLLSLVLSSESAGASWLHSSGGSNPAPAPPAPVHSNSIALQCDAKATCIGQHSHSVR